MRVLTGGGTSCLSSTKLFSIECSLCAVIVLTLHRCLIHFSTFILFYRGVNCSIEKLRGITGIRTNPKSPHLKPLSYVVSHGICVLSGHLLTSWCSLCRGFVVRHGQRLSDPDPRYCFTHTAPHHTHPSPTPHTHSLTYSKCGHEDPGERREKPRVKQLLGGTAGYIQPRCPTAHSGLWWWLLLSLAQLPAHVSSNLLQFTAWSM